MNKILFNARISWSFVVVALLFFMGCQGGGEGNGTASVRLSLNLSSSKTGILKSSSAPAPVGINSVRIEVTGPEMSPISNQVEIRSNEETVIELQVPAGPARRFVVTAFDIESTPRFRGEQTVDLVPGSSESIRISMLEIDVTVPLPIQISPKTAVLTRSRPNNPVTQTFTLANATTTEVDLLVNNQPDGIPLVGRTAPGGTINTILYTAPDTIPIDRTQTQIGVPIPIIVEAVDKTNPDRRDSAQVTMVTGPQLAFGQNRPVAQATDRRFSTQSPGQRSIAYHQGKAYVAWADCPEGCFDIFFSESTDGINWTTPPKAIANDQSGVSNPSLAVGPDGSIFIAYVSCYFCSSEARVQLDIRPPGQADFSTVPLTRVGRDPQHPTVAVSSQGVAMVAWSENRGNTGWDIVFQRVNKDGTLLDSTPQNITGTDGDFQQTEPVLSIGPSGEVFLAWLNENAVTATASIDNGASFLPQVQVSDDEAVGPFGLTLTATDTGTVFIAWADSRLDLQLPSVFFDMGKVGNQQLVFGADKPIDTGTFRTDGQIDPSLAWDGSGGLYVVFRGAFNNFTQNGIFLAKSINGGTTFTPSRIDIGTPQGASISYPSIVVDPAGRAFTIWTQSIRGLFSVFFSMGEDFRDFDT